MPSQLLFPALPATEAPTPTPSEQAAAHFAAKLAFETDAADVHAAMQAGERFVLLDSRGEAAWRQGRIPGAVHMPTATIAERAPREIPEGTPVVSYCWGPGCNGATRAALALARLGYRVKEMIGGYEYWVREGLAVEDDRGPVHRPADPLVAPLTVQSVGCDC